MFGLFLTHFSDVFDVFGVEIRAHIYIYMYIYIYIYIYIYLSRFCGHRVSGASLVTSRRDLDASKRGRRDPNPKTGMLGLTPAVVFRVFDPAKNRHARTARVYVLQQVAFSSVA